MVVKIEDLKNRAVNQLSGISYVPHTNSYFTIRNQKNRIHELDSQFKTIRDIRLDGWIEYNRQNDLEGIAYLGMVNGQPEVAIVNESGELFIGVIPKHEKRIYRNNYQKIIFDSGNIRKNLGPEGVGYDPVNKTFYIVYEKYKNDQLKIIAFPRPATTKDVNLSSIKWPITQLKTNIMTEDLSGIHFNTQDNFLWILSEESHCINIAHPNGILNAKLVLPDSRQYEGITINSKNGNIIIAIEPDIIEAYHYPKFPGAANTYPPPLPDFREFLPFLLLLGVFFLSAFFFYTRDFKTATLTLSLASYLFVLLMKSRNISYYLADPIFVVLVVLILILGSRKVLRRIQKKFYPKYRRLFVNDLTGKFAPSLLPRTIIIIVFSIIAGLLTIDSFQGKIFVYRIVTTTVSPANEDVYQIFFDTGQGYREQDSIKRNIVGRNKFIRTEFEIPGVKIARLRIDPGTAKGIVFFKHIQVTFENKLTRNRIPVLSLSSKELFENFLPLYDITKFEESGDLLKIRSSGDDPHFEYAHYDFDKALQYSSTILKLKIYTLLILSVLYFSLFQIIIWCTKKKEA